MPAPLTEYMLEAIIREGLSEIRADPTILDDIFEEFTDSYLSATFGAEHIARIKDYILGTNLNILQSWPRDEAHLPCVAINVVASDENQARDYFSDYAGDIVETKTPTPTTEVFTPTSLEENWVVVPLDVDISNVEYGLLFVDEDDNQFKITSVINTPTDKRIGLETIEGINIAGDCFVRYLNEVERYNKREIALTDRIILSIHALTDPKELKYWYYVILYIIHSKRDIFETKGYKLHSTSASDFNRLVEMLPKEYFTRFINISFWTNLSWKADKQVIANKAGINIRVPIDKIEIPASSEKSIITTEE